MPRRDYYAVLGLKRTATTDEVKRAFRVLALKYHPDRNPDDVDADRRFREVAEAYEVLADAEERARYDRLGPLYRPDGRPPTPEDLSAYVNDALAGLFRRRGAAEKGEDLRHSLSVPLEEVAKGAEREISVLRNIRCKRCEGTGADPDGGRRKCEHCEGSGKSAQRRLFRSSCAHCDGRGFVTVKRCERCKGEGRHDANETLKVRIPPGVATGQKLKIRNKGHESRGEAPPGDLYLLIAVAEHPLFRRRGDDLICEVPVTWPEAALGAELTVPTLDGTTTIRLPPGTPSGKIFRLSGRGLPSLDQKRRRGDLHLKAVVEIPTTLSDQDREAVRALAERLKPAAFPQRAAFEEALRARR